MGDTVKSKASLEAVVKSLNARVERLGQRRKKLSEAEIALRCCLEGSQPSPENIREVFWILDPHLKKVLFVSSAYEEVWGRTGQSLYDHPQSFWDAVHPQDRNRVVHQASLSVREVSGKEYRILQPHGDIRWIRERAFPIRDKSGMVTRVAGIAEDITRYRAIEESLQWNEPEVESPNDFIAFVDHTYRYQALNKQVLKRFGRRRGVILGRHLSDILGTQNFEFIKPFLDRCLSSESGHCCLWMNLPWGRRYLDLHFRPYSESDTSLLGIIIEVRDMTERRQVEEERGHFFTLSLDMLCIVGLDGYFRQMNPSFSRTLGLLPGELFSKPISDFVHPDDRGKTTTVFERLTQGQDVVDFENRWRCRDGSYRWFQWRVAPDPKRGLAYGVARDMTEHKSAEEDRGIGEACYWSLYDHAPVGIQEIDVHGRLVSINPAGLRMLGVQNPKDIQGLPFLDLVLPEDKKGVGNLMTAALYGQAIDLEFAVAGRAKSKILSSSFIPIKDQQGKVLKLLGVTQETIAHPPIKQPAEADEERFHSLSDALSQMVWTARPDGTFDYVKQPLKSHVPDPPGQPVGSGWEECLRPDDLAEWLKHWGKARETGMPYQMECRLLRTSEGAYRWHVRRGVSTQGKENRGGPALGANVAHTDLTGLQEALKDKEALLERQTNMLEQIQIMAQAGGWEVDLRTKALHWTDETYKIHEVSPSDFTPTLESALAFFAPESQPQIQAAYEKGRKFGEPWDLTLELITKGQNRIWVRCIGKIQKEEGIPVKAYGTLQNITDRKQTEELLRHSESQLRQVQKREAMGTLAGGIAHDFKNILVAILGYTELAVRKVPHGSPLLKILQEVLNAGERARDLIQQILTFSRQTERERQPVQLQYVIKDVTKFLRATLPPTIALHQNLGGDMGMVLADPTQMHQVLMNLCTNAEHAMRDTGGVLEITLEEVEVSEDFVAPHLHLKAGPYLRLIVADMGHGITPEVRSRIFEPFFTTKSFSEGTGMGLAVVHGIVTSHEGAILVDSQLGEGATFSVYLPKIMTVAEPVSPRVSGKTPVNKGRILFVDEEEPLVRLARKLLRELGYETTVRTSGMEALETVRMNPQRYDAVIIDQTMIHINQGSLSQELARIRPDLPIIMCADSGLAMTAEQAREQGIRAFLVKPLLTKDLLSVLHEVLETGAREKP